MNAQSINATLDEGDGKAVFDGLGVRMRLGKFLGGALDVRTHVLELLVDTPLDVELLQVDTVVRVGCDLLVRIQLPCVRAWSLHADLEAMVLDDACVVCGLALLTYQFAHSLLNLRAQGVEFFLTLVHAQLSCKHLVDDR